MANHSTSCFCSSSIFEIFLLVVPGINNIGPWERGGWHEEIFTTLYSWKQKSIEKCIKDTSVRKRQHKGGMISMEVLIPDGTAGLGLFQLSDITLCQYQSCHLTSLQHGQPVWLVVWLLTDLLHVCRYTCRSAPQIPDCNFAIWKLAT